jgi:hypothetical protein
MLILVGDNPFHGVSHLSQERARVRGDAVTNPEYAADLVMISLENGADGFMFSVSENTLSMLRIIHKSRKSGHLRLYAITPSAYEYVRLSGQTGISGLAKRFAKQMITSGNVSAIISCLRGVTQTDPTSLMRGFLCCEVSRIKSSAGKQADLDSMFLHEIVTDMGLALNLKWLFNLYIDFMLDLGIKPGFETRNFAFLVNKFREWNMKFREIMIAAPFNKVGFQMSPSKTECEQALASLPEPNVVAISILASGYLTLSEAAKYIKSLPNLKGLAVGISKEKHARETFKFLKERL